MTDPTGQPVKPAAVVGVASPARRRVLQALFELREATSLAVAAHLGLGNAGATHHLRKLVSEGLVTYRAEARGPGHPGYRYRLSPAGRRLFGDGSETLLRSILGVLSGLGAEIADRLLDAALADARPGPAHSGSPEVHRRRVLRHFQEHFGHVLVPGHPDVIEVSHCGVLEAAKANPRLCLAEARWLASSGGSPCRVVSTQAQGGNTCRFRVESARA